MPRGRPKKNKDELQQTELWDVLHCAKEMYNMYPNIFTPDLVSSALKNITLNPIVGTETDIDNALKNPKDSEEQLIGFSHHFELVDMLYKRQLLYLSNLPSFDLTYTCTNASKGDYKSKAYQKDEKTLIDFLNKFDHKKEFRTVLRQLFRQEMFFGVFRDDGDKYTLQELNRQYCKVTGRWEYGFIYDYNMYFFLQPGVDIDFYPKVFKKMFNDVFRDKNLNYNPALPIDKRNSSFVYWHQVKPTDGFWAWKLNPEIATQVPFFSPIFPDLVLKPLVRKLQKNKYVIESSKVLVALLPMLKESKSGNVKDMLALDPDTAGKFANLVRKGLAQEIQFAMGPFSDMKSFEWKSDGNNMLDQYNKVTVGQGGTNTRLLYATDRMNAIESKSSISIDEQVVTTIYPFFEDFLNYHINKRLKKFSFKFKLEGTEMPENKKQRFDDAMKLAQVGLVLPQKIASSIGILPSELDSMLDEANEKEWNKKLIPLLNIYNSKDGGRPQKADGEISSEGEQSRTDGSNINKGGQI
jgi:hypothetical protein